VCFNTAFDPEKQNPFAVKASVEMKTDAKPVRVFDAFTLKDVEWTYENGFVKIENAEFGPFKTRIFAAEKRLGVAEALKTWWGEKTKYWKRAPVHPVPNAKVAKDDTIELDEWEFSAAPEKGEWRKAGNSTWKLQFPDLKDFKGKAVYRAKFALPGKTDGSKCVLRFTSSTIYDKAVISVNGKKCGAFDRAHVHPELSGDKVFDISDAIVHNGENAIEIEVDGGSGFIAGICGRIWICEEKKLSEEIDLRGEWTAVMKDFIEEKPGKIPGKNFCRYLKKTVAVPSSWKGKRAFIRIVHPENTIGAILVNGRSRNLPGNGHVPFGNRETIYIGDLVKPGEDNTIEIWHHHTIPVDWKAKAWNWPLESVLNIDEVSIGLLD
jgi:hypothetical protein